MPAFATDQYDRAVGLCLGEALCLLLHHCLDRPAFLVQPVQLCRKDAGLFLVGGGEQAHAQVGLADTAACIDPRPKREAQIMTQRRPCEAAGAGEGGKPDIFTTRHHLEALGDERAIESAQLGDIGHRAERHEVEQIDQSRFGSPVEKSANAQFPHQRGAQKERDPDRREMTVRRRVSAFVQPIRVYQRKGTGQFRRTFVVIDDNYIDARRACGDVG